MNTKCEEQDQLEHPDLFTDIIKIDRIVDGTKRNKNDIIQLEDLHISIALQN